MATLTRECVQTIKDGQGNLVGIFYLIDRHRVVFEVQEADEEQLERLLNHEQRTRGLVE